MKKLLTILLTLALVLGLCACGADKAETTGPETTGSAPDEGTTFTLVIVHADETEKELTISTKQTYLANALIDEGILTEEGLESGMYNTVDGETASWEENQSYWAFYVGEDYATEGMNTTKIEDGATYKLVYTVG